MDDEPDDDLLDLLGKLDDQEAAVEDQISEYIHQDIPIPPIIEPDNILSQPETIMSPVDFRAYEDLPAELTEQSTQIQQIDTKKYVDRIDSVTDEILAACRNDRKEAQDTIDLLRGEVQKATNAGNNPARMWVDGLVKAVEVKSNINMTAVKALEASVKTLAALRVGGGINILNQQNVGGQDPSELLDQPPTSSDEW